MVANLCQESGRGTIGSECYGVNIRYASYRCAICFPQLRTVIAIVSTEENSIADYLEIIWE